MSVIGLRRDFHQHPELAFTEFRTAGRVVEVLQALGYEVIYGDEAMDGAVRKRVPSEEELEQAYQRGLKSGVDKEILKKFRGGLTAVVGILHGKEPGPTVAFRFDMDALPIQESMDEDHLPQVQGFISKYRGKMHACAHDGHTAIGIVLAEKMAKGEFAGTLKLIFQPAEEGVCGGARSIAVKGMVDDVDQIYCMHLTANMEPGVIYGGTNYLATTKLAVEFYGKAAHAASAPEKGCNALLGAATALLNIHAIPPYENNDVRINVGVIQGGTASNIVPDHARMSLETRAKTGKVNNQLVERVERIIKSSAEMHQLGYKINVTGESTANECDGEIIELVLEEARDAGFLSLNTILNCSASEDAAYLIQRVQECGGKGTYIAVGAGMTYAHHTTKFDIDEKVLPLSVRLLEGIARRTLKNGSYELGDKQALEVSG